MAWWWVATCALALYGLIAALVDVGERVLAGVGPAGDLPRVSIVVAARNREESIEAFLRTLARAATSDYGIPCEIVAVDDGSSDGTARVIERLAESSPVIRAVSSRESARPTGAETIGLASATGSVVIVCRLDGGADDAALAAFVGRMLRNRDLERGRPLRSGE